MSSPAILAAVLQDTYTGDRMTHGFPKGTTFLTAPEDSPERLLAIMLKTGNICTYRTLDLRLYLVDYDDARSMLNDIDKEFTALREAHAEVLGAT